jgi:hypothetical protein
MSLEQEPKPFEFKEMAGSYKDEAELRALVESWGYTGEELEENLRYIMTAVNSQGNLADPQLRTKKNP